MGIEKLGDMIKQNKEAAGKMSRKYDVYSTEKKHCAFVVVPENKDANEATKKYKFELGNLTIHKKGIEIVKGLIGAKDPQKIDDEIKKHGFSLSGFDIKINEKIF
ncbi:hypothetical protein KAR34_10175 [bacterium]|nr:hypothetical protein [bacterium]